MARKTPYRKLYGSVRFRLMVVMTMFTFVLPHCFMLNRQEKLTISMLFVKICIYGPGRSPGIARLTKRRAQ